jgi:hypothetical protein
LVQVLGIRQRENSLHYILIVLYAGADRELGRKLFGQCTDYQTTKYLGPNIGAGGAYIGGKEVIKDVKGLFDKNPKPSDSKPSDSKPSNTPNGPSSNTPSSSKT